MKKYLSYFYVILGATCWGFIGVFNRILGSVGVDVRNRVFVRNIPSMILLTLVFALFRREVFHVKPRHLPIFMASGFLSVLCLSWAYFNCQMECSLAVAAILLYLAPSMVVVMSAVLWKTPVTRRKLTALILALVCCALVSGVVGGELTASWRGLLFGLASAFCYATYTIFAHYGLAHYDSYTMLYWTFFFAGIGSLVFLDAPALAPALTNPRFLWGSAGLVLISAVLPYLFYTKGLEGVESGKAAIIANVEPVIAALAGFAFYGEAPTVWVLLGILCVLGGVVILSPPASQAEKESH